MFTLVSTIVSAQSFSKIVGTAHDYVGQEVKVYFYEDYLSNMRTQIASTNVKADSTFEISFKNEETRRLYIEVGKNNLSIYAQPGGEYNLFVTNSSPYQEEGLVGIDVEFFFVGLDTNDINYKIIVFEDEQLDFLKEYYNHRSIKSTDFVMNLEKFKNDVTEKYMSDSSQFLKTYIRYTIADLDNLAYLGERNEYEKYDFYLKSYPVSYQNDRYMSYLMHYYQKYEGQISEKAHEGFAEGIGYGSPTIIMNALGLDYTLGNVRVRELVMIRMLSEVYNSGLFYKKGIIQVLDSLSTNALFEEHKTIAKNIKYRLVDLVPGSEMPEITLNVLEGDKTLKDYEGKHVYFHFASSEVQQSIEDIKLIDRIQQKYGKYIEFVTVLTVAEDDPLLKDPLPFIKEHNISWDLMITTKNGDVVKAMNVNIFPYYILVDATSHVVAAPALTPRPNSNYETIENVLASIARYYRSMDGR